MRSCLLVAFLAIVAAGFGPARGADMPSPADAAAFVAKTEAELDALSVATSHIAWTHDTNITVDTNWLLAKAIAKATDASVSAAREAARFDAVTVDPVTRRKLTLLKRGLVLPAPSRAGAAQDLADLRTRLTTQYSTAKFSTGGKTLTLDDMEDRLRVSRDPAEIRTLWEGWRAVSAPPMAQDYARLVALANEGARELGYVDTGALWRSWYDMDPDAFAATTDRLWDQVAPLYRKLHCYVRGRLNARYGDAVQPKTGPIRADLTGNMWGQMWGNIEDIVAPPNADRGYDLTKALAAQQWDVLKIVHTADAWYQSIGFAPLPDTFWARSMFVRPRDREVVCHASAWDVDGREDVRVKACLTVTADDFYTAHHELGHNIYQRAYAAQPYLFRAGANDGFHEAIGDFAGMFALTPAYLKRVGLIAQEPGPSADIPDLLKTALDKVAMLPWTLLVDKWRWGVFAGRIDPAHYNSAWWELVRQYQGFTPPGPRPADAFDPGAKFHIADNTPYTRYFLATIYEFQFYRAACRLAGYKGALNRCAIDGNKKVGARFAKMLEMGQSQPWPEALAAFSGEREIDASALVDYFAPLSRWLDAQNKGQSCGWDG